MGRSLKSSVMVFLFLSLLFLITVSSQPASSSCSYTFPNNKEYATCLTLPHLNSYLHWTYDALSGTADIAFRATDVTASPSGNWVAWALNPSGSGMMGAQSLVAYKNLNGDMRAFTSSVQGFTLDQSRLSFNVTELVAESSDSQITMYANITLPDNRTTVNHVWQVGTLSNGYPSGHAMDSAHLGSTGAIDFTTGVALVRVDSLLKKKNIHGVLNAISWGILMPIGIMIARYLKMFKSANPLWFYLHIACQCSAYVVGVAGWATGMKLGSESKGITYNAHRNIGITLFTLATMQVAVGFLLRPKKDHKYRLYWNLFHWSVGYSVIILSIINVFKGLDILDPEKKWKMAYTIVIALLGCIALMLEASTWVVVWRRKGEGVEEKSPNGFDCANDNEQVV